MDSYALFWINKQWQHEVNKGLRRRLYRSALQRKAGTDFSSVPASLNLRLQPPRRILLRSALEKLWRDSPDGLTVLLPAVQVQMRVGAGEIQAVSRV